MLRGLWMFENLCKEINRKASGYTLAEMLIVMAIIVLLFLAMPPVTKKLFKQDITRKLHGRYECYWETSSSGVKTLKAHTVDENGNDSEGVVKTDTDGSSYCEFMPPQNVIFFVINAVGGGGAGASLNGTSVYNGTTVRNRQTLPKEAVSGVSYLYKGSPSVWPDWVTLLYKTNGTDLPWKSNQGYATDSNHSFDVIRNFDRRKVNYRIAGTAGRTVTSFVPTLNEDVVVVIKPGKGGAVATGATDEKGADGDPTLIQYKYGTNSPITALTAHGGVGGSDTKAQTSMLMLGQQKGDLGISSYASVVSKESGFYDMVLEADKSETLASRVPLNAGNGGNGEVNYLEDTSGDVMYEWNNYERLNIPARIGSQWVNFTDKLTTNTTKEKVDLFYQNLGVKSNCEYKVLPDTDGPNASTGVGGREVRREDICEETTGEVPGVSYGIFKYNRVCYIGKTAVDSKNKYGCASEGCVTFYINYNKATSTTTYQLGSYMPTKYSNKFNYCKDSSAKTYGCPYYNCTYKESTMEISCTTKLDNNANRKYDLYNSSTGSTYNVLKTHRCTTPATTTGMPNCSNGNAPVKDSYGNYTCRSTGGGDGAVVILW